MPKSKSDNTWCKKCNGVGQLKGGVKGKLVVTICPECNGHGKKQETVMAFWAGGGFPYVYSASGIMLERGKVYCPMLKAIILPMAVMKLKEGMELKDKLMSLKRRRRGVLDKMEELWNKELNELLPFRGEVVKEFWKEALGGDAE